METYFDRREGREKPVPDCARLGLIWNPDTQRCEHSRFMNVQPQTLFDDTQTALMCAENRGMGFLPGAVAAGSAAGPIGTVVGVVVGVVGTLFSKIFGGDDQATNYRPPADAATKFVQFDDARGSEYVAYDLGQASLAEAQRRGNRVDDIYSYYSAFISNSTYAGASSAARRVIEDAARINGVSISRAADLILTVAGVTRIVQPFLPGQQPSGSSSAPTSLPGYCPAGTYHPFPIGDPRQDECVPFPTWPGGSQTGSQPGSTSGQTGSQAGGQTTWQGAAAGAAAAALKYWLNPRTGRMEQVPPCPAGSVFDQTVGQCVSASGGGAPGAEEDNWWLWLLLAAGAIVVISDGGGSSGGGRSRR